MLNFSASLNDAAPVSPIVFAVGTKSIRKSDSLVDVFCNCLMFTIQTELSKCCV